MVKTSSPCSWDSHSDPRTSPSSFGLLLFPFSRLCRLTISAAGWTRATVGGSLRCGSAPVGTMGVQGPSPEAGMVMRSSLQTMLKSASNCRRPRWKCCSLSSSAHSTPLAVQVPGLSNIMEYFVKSYGTQPGALRVQFTSETLLGALFTSLNPRGLPRTAPMPWPELLLSRGLRRPAPSCAPLRRGISSPSLHHHHPLRGPRRTRRQSR